MHRLHDYIVLLWHLADVPEVSSADLIQRTRSALTEPTFDCILGLFPPDLCAHHFFAEISFITSISRSRSATIFLSLPFSSSSALSRFTSSLTISPNRLRQA